MFLSTKSLNLTQETLVHVPTVNAAFCVIFTNLPHICHFDMLKHCHTTFWQFLKYFAKFAWKKGLTHMQIGVFLERKVNKYSFMIHLFFSTY